MSQSAELGKNQIFMGAMGYCCLSDLHVLVVVVVVLVLALLTIFEGEDEDEDEDKTSRLGLPI